jgi:hypothetical protein
MNSSPATRLLTATAALGISLAAAWLAASRSTGYSDGDQAKGTLQLTITDADSKQTTTARVELLDRQGKGFVADDALLIGGD